MKVSIIIPYVKDRGYLDKAVESVETQNYPGEIEIIESQSENTVGFNINEGFKQADGDLVRFLCDDDELPPNSVQHSVDFFIKNYDQIDFFHSKALTIDTRGATIGEHVPKHTPTTSKELAAKNYIHGGTVVYKRKCFELQPWDVDLWTGEEYEYNIRLLHEGFKLGYCPEYTYRYRKHGLQKSSRGNRNLQRRIEAITKIKNKYK